MYSDTQNPASRTAFRRIVFWGSLFVVAVVGIALALRWSSPPAPGSIRENPIDGQRYAWIPAGGFQEGCSKFDTDCSADEKPAHDVSISKGFWIGQTEVTVGAYRRFATATRRAMPPEATFGGFPMNAGWTDVRMPIVNVDWNEGKAFCKWIGGALPTEAQWEYAARGSVAASRYGNLPQIAWTGNNSGGAPLDAAAMLKQDESAYLGRLSNNRASFHPTGLLAPNSFMLYDMLGNVWEWTADWYGENYYQAAERFDPPGQPNGDSKVLRGGSWTNIANAVRFSVRGRRTPVTRSVDTGFRCVW
jgi:formylglycine-generating enzyme required for sulfatase activity